MATFKKVIINGKLVLVSSSNKQIDACLDQMQSFGDEIEVIECTEEDVELVRAARIVATTNESIISALQIIAEEASEIDTYNDITYKDILNEAARRLAA